MVIKVYCPHCTGTNVNYEEENIYKYKVNPITGQKERKEIIAIRCRTHCRDCGNRHRWTEGRPL